MGRGRPEEWDALAKRMEEPQFQEHSALYKRQENLELIAAWAPTGVRRLLKTDLFEEGFGKDSLLDALAAAYPMVVGMDISRVVAAAVIATGAGSRVRGERRLGGAVQAAPLRA